MKPTTVYYVDDDPDDRMFFEEVVHTIGVDATIFESADAFQQTFHGDKGAIIFVDLNMPGKNGFDLLAEIRADDKYRQTPVIVLSTSSNEDGADRCFQLGASLYLTKANCLRALQESIEHILSIDWDHFTRNRMNFFCRY